MSTPIALVLALSIVLAAPAATAQEGPDPSPSDAAQTELDPQRLRHLLGVRETMADWMTGLGIAAWVSLTTTAILGAISFHDRYGFAGRYEDTPCAQGTAVWNEYCEGTVWPHAIAGGITTTLYVTTSMLGMFMPDPLHLGDQDDARGERIRIHRTIRIATTSLIIAQALLGLFISNADDWFGIDRQQHFDAMQALSVTHMALGAAAIVSLSAQGAVMIF
ncbi:hypothetical protein [Sandaracinus amylolyticus]|uniref:Uncharacterized protein n=1 Tax=Sandaracinus amylolyticus TaxID=927083 RepID=A0A0F6SDN8_9BACT|nr:hypothetical protein [Sandaracinus amylolyticus]AKF03769.1 hypothetical protein DB32_000918 [Sandaracinus amylolyticus]